MYHPLKISLEDKFMLIELVRSQPGLWNQKIKEYAIWSKDHLWNAIGVDINVPGNICFHIVSKYVDEFLRLEYKVNSSAHHKNAQQKVQRNIVLV